MSTIYQVPILKLIFTFSLKYQLKNNIYYKIYSIFHNLPLVETMASNKFHHRDQKKQLTPLQSQVGNALIEIENLPEFKNQLKTFTLTRAIELQVSEDKKEKNAIIVFVPYHHLRTLHAHYKKLSIQFEKRLKTTVLLIVTRTIQSRWIKIRKSQKRPNSRTLTAVHEAILDDLVLPGTIIGKRTRVRIDGSSYLRITLDKSQQHNLQERVSAIRAAYKSLTNKIIEIDFAQDHTFHVLKQRRAV